MKALRSLLAAVLAIAASSANATDKTDLWWNPAESGWGMTIANQGDTIFVTMYVYGTDNQPTWFVGTGMLQSSDSQGVNVYSGDWYRVTGPYYGATFNPAAVNAIPVGTYTYRELTVTTGQITYSVSGVAVTKNVQRQTLLVNPRLNGNYSGAYFSTTSGCTNQAQNGPASSFINASISGTTPSATQISILFGSSNAVCTLSGPYTQAGRMGALTGTWSCSNSFSGTASFFEIEAGTNALSARFNTHYNTIGCTEIGYLGMARIPPPQ